MRKYVWDVVCRQDALPFLQEITAKAAADEKKG
jgi:hypothetical protein